MRIGVPKEIKVLENRVGLTPASVRELVAHGHEVMVEHEAGAGDRRARRCVRRGGRDRSRATPREVFARAEMIVKVKEPQPAERAMLRDGQILFTYLHLAPDPEQAKDLVASNAVCIAYETVTSPTRRLAAARADVARSRGAWRCRPARTISRSRTAARACCWAACRASHPAQGRDPGRRRGRHACVDDRARHGRRRGGARSQRRGAAPRCGSSSARRSRRCSRRATRSSGTSTRADLVIGGVLIPGASAPKLVTRDMIARMKPGSVVVDVAIDQGGCFETSHPTTHADPSYVVDGVVHYCVANMPGGVPRTSTFALNNATLPFVLALADKGWRTRACRRRPPAPRAQHRVRQGDLQAGRRRARLFVVRRGVAGDVTGTASRMLD